MKPSSWSKYQEHHQHQHQTIKTHTVDPYREKKHDPWKIWTIIIILEPIKTSKDQNFLFTEKKNTILDRKIWTIIIILKPIKTSKDHNFVFLNTTHYKVSGGPIIETLHSNTSLSSTKPAENPSTGFLQRSGKSTRIR